MRELLTTKNDPKGILRTPCKPVKTIEVKAISIAQDLADYVYEHREDEIAPVSMAAPQLGESSRIIVFYPNASYRERDGIEVLINPEIIKVRKLIIVAETCLSIKNKKYLVRRAATAKVKGLNLDGRHVSYKAAGLFAQALQHEINHLDGVLIDSIGVIVK